MSKTYRRDKLKRLCEAGKLVLASSYHFDDLLGTDRFSGEMPVAMHPGHGKHAPSGICSMHPWDFTGPCGHARLNPDGTVYLYVHSNCNYTFRIKP